MSNIFSSYYSLFKPAITKYNFNSIANYTPIKNLLNNNNYDLANRDLLNNILNTNNNAMLSIFLGTRNDDYIIGDTQNNLLIGGNSADTLLSYAGNDHIIAGKGDDFIKDTSGSDLYTFSVGDGKDTITDQYPTGEDIDIVEFTEGVNKEDIALFMQNKDLVVTYGANDQIMIKDQMTDNMGIELLQFADGRFLTRDEINILFQGITTSDDTNEQEQDDTEVINNIIEDNSDKVYICSDDKDDIINAGGGKDYIYAGSGNDIINGGAGKDYIYAQSGNDIIEGGAGDDYLNGSTGNDIYIFNLGDGKDTITDQDPTGEDIDIVSFTEGINKEDIALFMQNNDLLVAYGTNDQITIKNQTTDTNGIEMLQLADGNFLTSDDINLIIQEMTAYADTNGFDITSIEQVQNNPDLMNIVVEAWG